MASPDLLQLLQRLADDAPDADGFAERVAGVRAALADAGLPLEAPPEGWLAEDPVGEAALLRDLLDDTRDDRRLGLGLALREESGLGDVGRDPALALDVLSALGLDAAAPVAAAVRREAGGAPELAAGHDPGALPVAAAVRDAAGPAPELADAHDPAAVRVGEAVRHAAGASPELGTAHDPSALPVAAAVQHAAGASPELGAAHDPSALPVAAAVRALAGPVDLADAVMTAVAGPQATRPQLVHDRARPSAHDPDLAGLPEGWLAGLLDHALDDATHVRAAEALRRAAAQGDREPMALLTAFADVGRRLREDLHTEAGEAGDLWQRVAPAIGLDDPERVEGWDESVLAQAVAHEAGEVDVVAKVLGVLAQEEAARKEAERRLASDSALGEEPELPTPVNLGTWAGVAVAGMAAALLLMLALPRVLDATGELGGDGFVERPLDFAAAGEVNVDEVRYGEATHVFVQSAEDDAPLIIWIDEEGSP